MLAISYCEDKRHRGATNPKASVAATVIFNLTEMVKPQLMLQPNVAFAINVVVLRCCKHAFVLVKYEDATIFLFHISNMTIIMIVVIVALF